MSLCRGCDHEFEDKNYCRTLPECPMNISTIRPPSFEKKKTKTCPVVGCKNEITLKAFCCNSCHPKMNYRKRMGVPPSIIYRKVLPKNWKTKYGVHKWERRKRNK